MHFQTERHLNNRRSSGKHSPPQSAGPTLWRARRNAIFLDWDTDARTDDKRERAKRTSPGLGRSARALFHHEAKTPCETNPKARRNHENVIAGKSFVSAFTKITNEPRGTKNKPDISDRSKDTSCWVIPFAYKLQAS